MQTLNYKFGNWRASARLSEVDAGKLMAVISVRDVEAEESDSRHTVVFDHEQGMDSREETGRLVQRLLESRYGG